MIHVSLFSFILAFVAALLVHRATSGRLFVIAPFIVWVTFEALWSWPATIYVQITGSSTNYAATLMLAAFVLFIIGFVMVASTWRAADSTAADFRRSSIQFDASNTTYAIVIGLGSLLLFGLGFVAYGGTPPLLSALRGLGRGDALETTVGLLSEGRQRVTTDYYFGGEYRGQGLILEILRFGWPMLAVMAALIYGRSRRKLWLAWALVLVVLSFLYGAGSGERSQLVLVGLHLLVAAWLSRVWPRRATLLASCAALALVFLVGPLSSQMLPAIRQTLTVGDSLIGSSQRVLLGNGLTNIEVIEFIESGKLDHRHGQIHAEKLVTALPGVTLGLPFSREVQILRRPAAPGRAFASMTYFGVLFADFGPIGVLIAYGFIGAIVATIQQRIFRFRKDPLAIAGISFAIVNFGDLALGSTVSFGASLLLAIVLVSLARLALTTMNRPRHRVALEAGGST